MICPLFHNAPGGSYAHPALTDKCITALCAWWVPTGEDSGACAVAVIGTEAVRQLNAGGIPLDAGARLKTPTQHAAPPTAVRADATTGGIRYYDADGNEVS